MGYEKTERTLIQVPMPPTLITAMEKRLKKLQAESPGETRLEKPQYNDIYDGAITWFLKNQRKDPSLYYFMSSRQLAPHAKPRYRSMWIDSKLFEKVKKRAETDSVSVNRVVYSALEHYMAQIGQNNDIQ